ncbi:hypothetical protein [Actinoplanes sp. NBRC 103695]|uniref:hypothetical protein n=1 Tax=Actinoplanes sp. NBRC 103695 TaxID=3032202 RepID=UPI0024A0F06B|nr:hypothetical protein [Actinoplanes sp. NBRC 103695]GLY96568.1 hypothetical protein Acsp02_38230 [Actinoplanes sp. NBRC 103695]
MVFDATRFIVGDEWAYRPRDDAPSERVKIRSVKPKKSSARVEILFLDDPDSRVENQPAARLRVPWTDVAAYDLLMANWQRIDDHVLDDVEDTCVEEVFQLLIPDDVATVEWNPVRNATKVHDRARLATILGAPVDEILHGVQRFEHKESLMVSPVGTLLIARAACREHPIPVLDVVVEQEKAARQKCKHGFSRDSIRSRAKEDTSPEYEYHWYRRYDRPRHELLRQWCGHRSVTVHERLLAAEAETERLDILLARVIEALEKAGDDMSARIFAEEHERDRVTPWTVRPVIDRPLHPSEIPVREIRVRGGRWWH